MQGSPAICKLPHVPKLQLVAREVESFQQAGQEQDQTPLATPATKRNKPLTLESQYRMGYDADEDIQAMQVMETYTATPLDVTALLATSKRICPEPGNTTSLRNLVHVFLEEQGEVLPLDSARQYTIPMNLAAALLTSPAPRTPAKTLTPTHHHVHKMQCVMLNTSIRSTQLSTADLVPGWEQQLADAAVFLAPLVGEQQLGLGRSKLLTETCQRLGGTHDSQQLECQDNSQGGASEQLVGTMRISNVSQDDKDQQEVRQVLRTPYHSDGGGKATGQLADIQEDASGRSEPLPAAKASNTDQRDTALTAFQAAAAGKAAIGMRKVRGPLAVGGAAARSTVAPGVPQLQGLPLLDLRKSVTTLQSARAQTARDARDTARERDVMPSSLRLPPLESSASPVKCATSRDVHRDRTLPLTSRVLAQLEPAVKAATKLAPGQGASPTNKSIKSFPLRRIRNWWSCSMSWESEHSSSGKSSSSGSGAVEDTAAAISNLHLVLPLKQELGTTTPISTVRLPRLGLDSHRASLPHPEGTNPKSLAVLSCGMEEVPGRHECVTLALELLHTVGNSDSAVVRRGLVHPPVDGDMPVDTVVKIYSRDRVMDGVAEILALEHLVGWTGAVQLMGYGMSAAGELHLLLQSCDCSLDEWAEQQREVQGEAWIATALSVFVHVAQLVAGLHSLGVAHCDLKPQNILMLEGQPLLADFSEARAAEQPGPAEQQHLHVWEARGTEAYNSSEMHKASQEEPVDVKAADVWGLACILFELLTGSMLFQGACDNMRPQLPKGPHEIWMTTKEVQQLLAGCGGNDALEAQVRSLILDVCQKQALRPTAQQVADRAAAILSGL